MQPPPATRKITVGWNEWVALPDWRIAALRAKVDTGARTSALHVENIVPLAGRRVRFDIVVSDAGRRSHIVAPVSRTGRVRSSTGHAGTRYFVTTRVQLGPLEREVELSLVDRSAMRFRMLLGRTALAGVLVDPVRARLHGRPARGR
jgi:hypothetical protein